MGLSIWGSSGSGRMDRGRCLKERRQAENSPADHCTLPGPSSASSTPHPLLHPRFPPWLGNLFSILRLLSCFRRVTCVGRDLARRPGGRGPSPLHLLGNRQGRACLLSSGSLSLIAVSLASHTRAFQPEHSSRSPRSFGNTETAAPPMNSAVGPDN